MLTFIYKMYSKKHIALQLSSQHTEQPLIKQKSYFEIKARKSEISKDSKHEIKTQKQPSLPGFFYKHQLLPLKVLFHQKLSLQANQMI